MDNDRESGVFLSLNDCMILFPRLKESESFLSKGERIILLKMEKVLYANLSIGEMEDLLDSGAKAGSSASSIFDIREF